MNVDVAAPATFTRRSHPLKGNPGPVEDVCGGPEGEFVLFEGLIGRVFLMEDHLLIQARSNQTEPSARWWRIDKRTRAATAIEPFVERPAPLPGTLVVYNTERRFEVGGYAYEILGDWLVRSSLEDGHSDPLFRRPSL